MYDSEQQQKLLEIEFRELFVTFRHYIQIVASLIAAFVAAYVTVIGVAITTQSFGLVLIATIFPIAIAISMLFFGRLVGAIFFTALNFEKNMIGRGALSFSVLMALTLPKSRERMLEVFKSENSEEQMEKLRRGYGFVYPTTAVLCLFSWIVGQIILVGYLYWVPGWSLAGKTSQKIPLSQEVEFVSVGFLAK